MSAAIVALDGVTLSFGKRPALRGVTLRVEPGESVSFIGPNGSGKSTCLRLLIGLAFRDSGAATVLGMDPDRDSAAIRRNCCYLPGETSLYPMMTGAQLLEFAHSGYPRRDEALSRRMLEFFDLPLQRKVYEYSAGMKQKLALLVTLVPDVDLYLLDEPDRNLDGATQDFMREVIAHLRERGKTVLFSSHQLGEIGNLAHRLIFMSDGHVIDDDEVREVKETLNNEVRIRLTPGTRLPDGAEEIIHDPDGWIRVRTTDHPLRWLAQLDPEQIVAVDLGSDRLDVLYRRLTARPRAEP